MVAVIAELAAIADATLLQMALAMHPALLEATLVTGAVGIDQLALAMEQAEVELTGVALAASALPGAGPLEQAILELALVIGTIGVVEAPFALQAAVHHLAAVAATIGQHGVGWQQGFAFAARGQQQGEGERGEVAEHGGYPVWVRVEYASAIMQTGRLSAPFLRCRSDQTKHSDSDSAM